jgi:hypothetical protein
MTLMQIQELTFCSHHRRGLIVLGDVAQRLTLALDVHSDEVPRLARMMKGSLRSFTHCTILFTRCSQPFWLPPPTSYSMTSPERGSWPSCKSDERSPCSAYRAMRPMPWPWRHRRRRQSMPQSAPLFMQSRERPPEPPRARKRRGCAGLAGTDQTDRFSPIAMVRSRHGEGPHDALREVLLRAGALSPAPSALSGH